MLIRFTNPNDGNDGQVETGYAQYEWNSSVAEETNPIHTVNYEVACAKIRKIWEISTIVGEWHHSVGHWMAGPHLI